MAKPAKWDSMTPGEQEAWRVKQRGYQRKYSELDSKKVREAKRKYYEANFEKCREYQRKHYAANPEKHRKSKRKWREANLEKSRKDALEAYYKTRQQSAADQFFIMAGAAESISKLKPKQ